MHRNRLAFRFARNYSISLLQLHLQENQP
jgi:hypothetical protein